MSPKQQWFPGLASIAALALSLSACGGASSGSAPAADFVSHAPTSASLDLEVADATAVASALPYAEAATPGLSLALAPGMTAAGDGCHPHLFVRTAEVVWRLNAIFRRHLRHVDALIARGPAILAGDTATWTDVTGTVEPQRKLTITRSADGLTYGFELDLAPAGQTPPVWVTIMTGHVTDASAGAVTERTGALALDYDALRTVVPAERLAGKLAVTFDRVKDPSKPAPGVKRSTEVTFDAFSFGPHDLHAPRSGTFSHLAEPGLGGSVAFQDDVVLLCPANPDALEADTTTHARWYVAADGAVHGRADARATGGQIAAGDTWMGVTCHQGVRGADPTTSTDSSYWLMKLEDPTGATLQGHERAAGAGPACDPVFGAVPTLADATSDYAFPSGPLGFPNAW